MATATAQQNQKHPRHPDFLRQPVTWHCL